MAAAAARPTSLALLLVACARVSRAPPAPRSACPRAASSPAGEPGALSRAGAELAAEGRFAESFACHRAATAELPDEGIAWFHFARAADAAQNRQAEARAYYRRALDAPSALRAAEAMEAHFGLGRLLREASKPDEAAEQYRAVLAIDESKSGAHIMLATTLGELGRTDEAIAHYSRGLALAPSVGGAYYNYANTLSAAGRAEEAAAQYREAIRLEPGLAVAYETLAEAHLAAGELDAAYDVASSHVAHAAATGQPHSARVRYVRGRVRYQQRRLEDAIGEFEAAVALDPKYAYALNDLGNALSESVGRQAEARAAYAAAADADPSFAEAHSNLGSALKALGGAHLRGAEAAFGRALALNPRLREAHKNLGAVHAERGRHVEAIASYKAALAIDAAFWPAIYALLDTEQFTCAWRGYDGRFAALRARLRAHVGDGGADGFARAALNASQAGEREHGGLAPFNTFTYPLPTQLQVWAARLRAARDQASTDGLLASGRARRPSLRWAAGAALRAAGSVLRVGLVSADFGPHPVGFAALPWVHRLRHAAGVEVYCFGTDGERAHAGNGLRRKLGAACDAFVDLSALGAADAAALIARERVHALVNLVGHTAGSRHDISHLRPAPVQAAHYGFAGTTGVDALGYIVVDAAAAPPGGHSRRHFTERLALMPASHFVAPHALRFARAVDATARAAPPAPAPLGAARRERPLPPPRAVARAEGGWFTRAHAHPASLPPSDRAFVLCHFNQLYKLEPASFGVWANALRRVPRSALWLSRISVRKQSSVVAEAHLLDELRGAGVHAAKLTFSWRLDDADFIPARALADVAVDSVRFNGHTTGADTLWAGVPTVGVALEHLAGRATAGFARALGMSELIAADLKAYESMLAELGTRSTRMAQLRHKLISRRLEAPLFDLDAFSHDYAALLRRMLDVHAAGLRPMHVIPAASHHHVHGPSEHMRALRGDGRWGQRVAPGAKPA